MYKIMNLNGSYQKDEDAGTQKIDLEISNFLDILDPHQCDKITLSDIVQLFSSYKVDII